METGRHLWPCSFPWERTHLQSSWTSIPTGFHDYRFSWHLKILENLRNICYAKSRFHDGFQLPFEAKAKMQPELCALPIVDVCVYPPGRRCWCPCWVPEVVFKERIFHGPKPLWVVLIISWLVTEIVQSNYMFLVGWLVAYPPWKKQQVRPWKMGEKTLFQPSIFTKNVSFKGGWSSNKYSWWGLGMVFYATWCPPTKQPYSKIWKKMTSKDWL